MRPNSFLGWVACCLIALIFIGCTQAHTNKSSSMDRLVNAKANKKDKLERLLQKKGLSVQGLELFLRAFKKEEVLEVWVKEAQQASFQLLMTYAFCKNSGGLGPKRKEGDRQIPEGFYRIDRFNAKSKFHLSLGLNYPNASDKVRSHRQQPGSDIFIHGGCLTVGCIPITDDKIEELFVLADMVRTAGRSPIRVHIFPSRLEKTQLAALVHKHPEHADFWQELQKGYLHFEKFKRIPRIDIDDTGAYLIQ